MDEEIKKHLLVIIPEKINLLIERHEECGKQYGIFFESMQKVFADDFEKDPEATLEQYLKLNDKECAWEEGDSMTRDMLLNNFIGREIARELNREHDAMKDFDEGEVEEIKKQLEEVLQENRRLKKERDAYMKTLSPADKEYKKLKESGEYAEKMERYAKRLERLFQKCL